MIKPVAQCRAEFGPWPRPFRGGTRGAGGIGLLAQLGPLGEAGPRGARPRARRAQWPRTQRGFGMVDAVGAEVQVWQGLRLEHHG
jgi:hypothetical protein